MTGKTNHCEQTLSQDLATAIAAWADETTSTASARRADLLRAKERAVSAFFASVNKPIDQVTAQDVKAWRAELEGQALAPATIYARISQVSSFYEWALEDPALAEHAGQRTSRGSRAYNGYPHESSHPLITRVRPRSP